MKQRITVSLEPDVARDLELLDGRNVSDSVNRALREALTVARHRRDLIELLDELDASPGAPTKAEIALGERAVEEDFGPVAAVA